jgi:dephospho-CoA kinase
MKVIGLTGGVGCGKSTVCAILQEKYKAFIIMADDVGHLAMKKDCETYRQILTLFGDEILTKEGEIDRKALGDIVFLSPQKLSCLNDIIHPFVRKTIEGMLTAAKEEKVPFVVLEAAILVESGYTSLCDEIWLVTCDKQIREERLRVSRGYTKEKFEAIFSKQLSDEELVGYSKHIIKNNGSKDKLEEQIKVLLEV